LGGGGGAAHAQAQAQPAEVVLFLGVRDESGRLDEPLTAAVQKGLVGRISLSAPQLDPVDTELENVDKLLARGQRASAALVLVGQVRATGPQGYGLQARLFNIRTLQAFAENSECTPCGEPGERSERLLSLIEALLVNHGVVLKAVAPTEVAPGPAPEQIHRRRTILAGTLGGVAAAALLTGITLAVLTHNPDSRQYTGDACTGSDGLQYQCFNNYTPGYAVAFATAGLATVGLALSLTLPRPAKKRPAGAH
jgi:hypothetical protein